MVWGYKRGSHVTKGDNTEVKVYVGDDGKPIIKNASSRKSQGTKFIV